MKCPVCKKEVAQAKQNWGPAFHLAKNKKPCTGIGQNPAFGKSK